MVKITSGPVGQNGAQGMEGPRSRQKTRAADKYDIGRASQLRRADAIKCRGDSGGLEAAFWRELRGIAAARGLTVAALIEDIAAAQKDRNLPAAIRLLVAQHRSRNRRRSGAGP